MYGYGAKFGGAGSGKVDAVPQGAARGGERRHLLLASEPEPNMKKPATRMRAGCLKESITRTAGGAHRKARHTSVGGPLNSDLVE